MNNPNISIRLPFSTQTITPANPLRINTIRKQPRKKQELQTWSGYWLRYEPYLRACGLLTFTVVAIITGVLIVYLTSPKNTSRPCQFGFRSATKTIRKHDSRPRQIVAGDFNCDQHLDVVVANSGTDNIGIFLNNRNGSFHPQITSSTGIESRPYSVAVGHLNNDTHLDVVVANHGTNSIGVLLGYGNGSFSTPIVTSLGPSRPLFLTLAHFNNDTFLDVVVANYGTFTIAVLLGEGDGSFRMHEEYEMGHDSMPCSVAVADLNRDNRSDIIVVNRGTSELVLLLSTTNQSFVVEKYWTDSGSQPSSVATGYFNKDGVLDIAVAFSGTSSVGIFLGMGNVSFTDRTTHFLDVGSRPEFLAVGDFNNDMHADIAIIDAEYDNLLILRGYENGSFSIITRHSTRFNSDPSALVVSDFDNDNQLDVVISNNGTNNVLLLTAYLTFPMTTRSTYRIENNAKSNTMITADVNHDNYIDIIMSDGRKNYTGVFLNLGNGSFNGHEIKDMNNFSSQDLVIAGDVNNDGYLDIVVIMTDISSIGILLGYDNGTFAPGYQFPTGSYSTLYSVSLDDLNNDGHLDITLSNHDNGYVYFFWGLGEGSFTNATLLLSIIYFHASVVKVADINRDTIPDVIVAAKTTDYCILVFYGYRNGSFHTPLFVSTDNNFVDALTIGDLNGDDRLDIIYTSMTVSYVGVLLGHGNGSFDNVTKYFTVRGGGPRFISLGYYNEDAFVDIAVSLLFDASINIYLGVGNGSFGSPIRIATGETSYPRSIVFADVNNDGQQDVVIGDAGEYAVQVFFVHSVSDFTRESSYITGSSPRPSAISIGDLNNDGKSDLVVANSGTHEVQVLMNYRHDTFMSEVTLSTGLGSHPRSVTIADFNQDHFCDIAVVNGWTDTMNILLGQSDGSFSRELIYSLGSGSSPYSIVAGDLNDDDRIDVVTVSQDSSSVGVFLAFNYVTFVNSMIDVSGSRPRPIYLATADFNNDRLIDIVVLNLDVENFGIYLNYGNGTFSEQITVQMELGSSAYAIAAGDFDHDNNSDLVVSHMYRQTISVYLGYGNGSFQSPTSYSTGNMSSPYSLAITDFNNDKHLDVIVAIMNAEVPDGDICIFLGYGNGSFRERILYATADLFVLVRIIVGDLNNDRIPDIVYAASFGDGIGILFGNDDNSSANVTKLFIGKTSIPVSIALGDFDHDQSIDIAAVTSANNDIVLFFGYGNGSFSLKKTLVVRTGVFLSSIMTIDVNNDTNLDILVADGSMIETNIIIFYGFGDGNFTPPKYYSTGLISQPGVIATGDLNNDGKVDLVTCYFDRGSIAIFIQKANEPFGSSTQLSTGNHSRPTSVVIGDFNNDNHSDIAVTNSLADNFGVLPGYGNGEFTQQITFPTGINSLPSAITTDHFNDDPFLDIAVVNTGSDSISIFLGHATGNFTQLTNYSTGVESLPIAIAAKDMNRDGYIDLIVANRGSNEVLIFLGIGNGLFHEPKRYPIGYDTRPQSVAIGDINNDDMFDIAVANDGAGYVEILLQTC